MRAAWAFALLLSVTGCADDSQERFGQGPHCPPHNPEVLDPTGVGYQYVVDSVDLAGNATEAQILGLDLDCDPQNRPDNALGQIISSLSYGYDLDLDTNLLIDAGELLHLVQVQTTSFDDATGVGVLILHGEDLDGDPSDNFTGEEPFGLDASRGRGLLSGRVEDGLLTADYGAVPLAVTLAGLEEPVVMRLVGARIEIERTDTGIQGRIGGALTEDELNEGFLPLLHEGWSRIIDRDCDELGCEDGSQGQILVDLFDDCSETSRTCDVQVSLDELRTSDLLSSLLSPDVNLFDETGEFNPLTDGVKDALSFGLGFTAVPASFSP